MGGGKIVWKIPQGVPQQDAVGTPFFIRFILNIPSEAVTQFKQKEYQ
jgi:tetrahydromethanopterin S-methyltransferase subunit A